LPKPVGVFVTGTDTGVGKTVIAGALARIWHDRGLRVGVFKPIATGCDRRMRQGLISPDAEFLAHCADSADNLGTINPVRYRQPLAPAVAAERAHRPIDYEAIWTAYRWIAAHSDVVVVEGVGGLLVPLDRTTMVADLAGQLGLPLVVVARAGLGTINHTLLTVEAARSRGLEIAAIVFNFYSADRATLAEETNPEVVARYAKLDLPIVVPRDAHTDVRTGAVGVSVLQPLRHWAHSFVSRRR